MRNVRTLLISTAAMALVATTLAAPVAAATKGQLAIVNGVPNTRIHICIDGREVKSGLKYGGKIFRALNGSKKLKFFKADPRRCRGVKLGTKTIAFDPSVDLTMVVTRNLPKLVLFDNTARGVLTSVSSNNSYFLWRHAADLGVVWFRFRAIITTPEDPIPPEPAALEDWAKGDQFGSQSTPGLAWVLRATRPDKKATIAGPRKVWIGKKRRYEWYLLGTKPRNARFAVFSRPIESLGP